MTSCPRACTLGPPAMGLCKARGVLCRPSQAYLTPNGAEPGRVHPNSVSCRHALSTRNTFILRRGKKGCFGREYSLQLLRSSKKVDQTFWASYWKLSHLRSSYKKYIHKWMEPNCDPASGSGSKLQECRGRRNLQSKTTQMEFASSCDRRKEWWRRRKVGGIISETNKWKRKIDEERTCRVKEKKDRPTHGHQ